MGRISLHRPGRRCCWPLLKPKILQHAYHLLLLLLLLLLHLLYQHLEYSVVHGPPLDGVGASAVGSDKAMSPDDEEESTWVSLHTSVINPIVVSRLVPVKVAAGASSESLSLSDMIE